MNHSTIAAIATPPGIGGIGIIKISGADSFVLASRIFCPGLPGNNKDACPVNDPSFFSPWKIYHGHIVDTGHGRVYDEVILAVMPAPSSYTKEDVVEIQAHGGSTVLESILSLVIKTGARLAQPGEFTRRAFINGRIDLTQAEAVIDLINAKSTAAIDIAFEHVTGKLSFTIDKIRNQITESLAIIEAMVDFPDDAGKGGDIDPNAIAEFLSKNALYPICELIDVHENHKSIAQGFRVVIAGAPNAGKSSILNRLIGRERSIVTELPGTTRDFIEAPLYAEGTPVTLIDTAGLISGEIADPVEKIGVQKARQHIDDSDLVLLIIDATCCSCPQNFILLNELEKHNPVIVINKTDLVTRDCSPAFFKASNGFSVVKTSAKHNIGIDTLKEMIGKKAKKEYLSKPGRPVPNFRHKSLLLEAKSLLDTAVNSLNKNISPELISIDLRHAYEKLGEIVGDAASPDVLDRIFSQYCVGK